MVIAIINTQISLKNKSDSLDITNEDKSICIWPEFLFVFCNISWVSEPGVGKFTSDVNVLQNPYIIYHCVWTY